MSSFRLPPDSHMKIRLYVLDSYAWSDLWKTIKEIRQDKKRDYETRKDYFESGGQAFVTAYQVRFPAIRFGNSIYSDLLAAFLRDIPGDLDYRIGYDSVYKAVILTSLHTDLLLEKIFSISKLKK